MTKSNIILLQEAQLNVGDKTLANSYFSNKAPVVNNADVISNVFEPTSSQIEQAVQQNNVTDSRIDMEDSVVNMNPVVSNDITNQVFGGVSAVDQISATPANDLVTPTFETQKNVIDNPSVLPNNSFDVPYQEPTMVSMLENDIIDEANFKYINSLRDKLTNFYNDMNMELDKLQEQVVKKSGSSLVGSVTDTNVVDSIIEPVVPQTNNLDETLVIPRDVMNNAINNGGVNSFGMNSFDTQSQEVQPSMSQAA